MKPEKTKATDYVIESLKLIVTLSALFFGGILAYRAKLNAPVFLWAYYSSLAVFSLSAILSVANINSLINKVFRGDEDAIQHKEARILNALSTLSLLLGMILGAIFLSLQEVRKIVPTVSNNQTTITDSEIIVGKMVQSNITIKKDENGKVIEVIIAPN